MKMCMERSYACTSQSIRVGNSAFGDIRSVWWELSVHLHTGYNIHLYTTLNTSISALHPILTIQMKHNSMCNNACISYNKLHWMHVEDESCNNLNTKTASKYSTLNLRWSPLSSAVMRFSCHLGFSPKCMNVTSSDNIKGLTGPRHMKDKTEL